jgi:hypothetical protein
LLDPPLELRPARACTVEVGRSRGVVLLFQCGQKYLALAHGT